MKLKELVPACLCLVAGGAFAVNGEKKAQTNELSSARSLRLLRTNIMSVTKPETAKHEW